MERPNVLSIQGKSGLSSALCLPTFVFACLPLDRAVYSTVSPGTGHEDKVTLPPSLAGGVSPGLSLSMHGYLSGERDSL